MSDRRQDLLDTLASLLPELGYERASIGKIADRAGVRSGLVHYYFPSKAAILEALVGQLAQRLRQRLEGAGSADSLLSAALALGDGEDRGAVTLFVAILAETRIPEVQGILDAELAAWSEQLTAELSEAEAAGVLALVLGYWQLGVVFADRVPPGSALPTARRMLEGLA